MAAKKHKYPIIYVEWLDAATKDEWHSAKEAKSSRPHPCHTVGWLLGMDKDRINIAETYSIAQEDEEIFASLVVPRASVSKLVYIKK